MPLRHLEERSLDKYFDSIRHLPLLTAEEERINGRLWQNDHNPEGLRRLVEGNLRYVVKEARKFEGMGLDLLDLISEGNLGLIEAAKRFDPLRENKFLTYASWWLNRVTQKLSQALGRVPLLQEIADAANLSIEDVERYQLLQQTTSTVSTEQGLGDSDLTVGDSLEQEVEPSAMHTLDQESFMEQIEASLASLNEKERTIITLHFGIGGEDPLTLEQIGKRFQPPISRERVRQLEERAFARIRDRRREILGGFLRGGDGP